MENSSSGTETESSFGSGKQVSYESIIEKAYHTEMKERLDGVHGCAAALKFFKGDRAREARAVSILETLKCDSEPKVRLELCVQLKSMALYCGKLAQRDYFYKSVLENVVYRCLVDLVKDGTSEVRRFCKKNCLEICAVDLRNGPLLRELLFAQAHMMAQNKSSLFRLEGLDLWFDLKPDREKTKEFIPMYKEGLSSENAENDTVRSYFASKLKDFCVLLNWSVFKEEFLELVILLTEDKDVSVRSHMAAVLIEAAKMAPEDDKVDTLIPLYDDLLTDSSRIVRHSAFERLGMMIFTTRKRNASRRVRSRSVAHIVPQQSSTSSTESSLLRRYDNNRRATEQPLPNMGQEMAVSTKSRIGESATVEFHSRRTMSISDIRDWLASVDREDEDSDSNSDHNPQSSLPNPGSSLQRPMQHQSYRKNVALAPLVPEEDLNDDYQTCREEVEFDDDDNSGDTDSIKENVDSNKHPKSVSFEEDVQSSNYLDVPQTGDSSKGSSQRASIYRRCMMSHSSASDKSTTLSSTYFEELADSQDVVNSNLLKRFLEMGSLNEPQMLESCARNLPAVAASLGRDYWNIIQPVFSKLENDMEWKVRQKIAASLHELAKILGPSLTEVELLPTFESCFNDVDEVRGVMVKNLASFMFRLGSEESRKLLRNLNEFAECENERDWRYRLSMVEQLQQMIDFLVSRDIKNYVWPMTKQYAVDHVTEVRKEAFVLIGKILSCSLTRRDVLFTATIREFIFKHFYSSQNSKGRVAFAQICSCLVQQVDYSWFSNNFGDALLSLQTSKVKDVKIALEKTMTLVESIYTRDALTKRQAASNVASRNATPRN